jgi:hypothetical protein
MFRKPTAGVVLALLLAGIVGPVVAMPHQALAGIRAATCCGGKCPNAMPVRATRGCCEIRQAVDHTAALSQAKRSDASRSHVLLPPPSSIAIAGERDAAPGAWSLPAGQRAAPPIFLLTRSLRL